MTRHSIRNIIVIGLLASLPFLSRSQLEYYPRKFFQPMSLNGNVNFQGGYRYQEGTTNDIFDIQNSPIINGGILLNTKSYFWHPCIMTVDLGGEYNPGIQNNEYLVSPDLYETKTFARFDGRVDFFCGKPVNLGAYANYFDGFVNRDNMTNSRMKSLNYGARLYWINRILPVYLNYDEGEWEENDIGTDRDYYTFHERFQGKLEKSFTSLDKNEFIYYHNIDRREDLHISKSENISDNFTLNDWIYFDKNHKYVFNSYIFGINQKGTDTFKRVQTNENLNLELPVNLRFNAGFNYAKDVRMEQQFIQYGSNISLSHQLYESLLSSVSFEHNNINQTYYKEQRSKIGFDLNYQKRIPKGSVILGGSYYLQNVNHKSDSYELRIYDESHTLTDGKIEMLDVTNVILPSTVVTDVTGTIIYILNFDYILIERNAYVEIQRIPGGQIPNNGVVLVDYTVFQQGSYHYNGNYISVNAGLNLFNNLINIYYQGRWQDYFNLENTEFVTLDYLNQNLYGLKLTYEFASIGAEYEDYNSSITPYDLWSYFLVIQGNSKNNFIYAFNVNVDYYHMLYNNTYQTYADAKGMIRWNLTEHWLLNSEIGYRKQIGEGLNLDLIYSKTELTANYRKLYVTAGLELYHRIWLGEQLNYYNVYVKLVRTFDWVKR